MVFSFKILAIIFFLTTSVTGFAQDKPEAIAKKDLPKLAECVVCSNGGMTHGLEKPAAGMMYKGKAFYFCNKAEVKGFVANAEMYIPLVLPMPMPELDFVDTSGKVWNSEAFKGKVVVLDYWATWCKPCLEMKPALDKLGISFKGQNFEILSVSIDEKQDTLTKFLAKKPWGNPVIHDKNKSWAKFKVLTIPTLFIVQDGQIVKSFNGKIDLAEVNTFVGNLLKVKSL